MTTTYTPDFSLSRDQRLFTGGEKRILALDGGGIRGLISLGILKRIEETLGEAAGRPDTFALADYFDLIAGTSTGSIIASALAMGWRVERVHDLYKSLGPTLFPTTRVKGLFKFRRKADALQQILRENLCEGENAGDGPPMTFESSKLKTGLMICTKRIDTDSAWVLTNCPKAQYWFSPQKQWFPNKDYELAMFVRASAAAPTFFEPVRVVINEKTPDYPEEVGLFVDGAISGHNNPALQAILTATVPAYGFGEVDENGQPKGWEIGPDKLMVVNVGTGWYREKQDIKKFSGLPPALQAIQGLKGMINDTVRNDLLLLQSISNSAAPWYINSEVGGLDAMTATREPLLSYQRYDASLTRDDFLHAIGYVNEVGERDPDRTERACDLAFQRIMQMDNGTKQNIDNAFDCGYAAGRKVELSHFPSAFAGPLNS